jgi:hypothetical protein
MVTASIPTTAANMAEGASAQSAPLKLETQIFTPRYDNVPLENLNLGRSPSKAPSSLRAGGLSGNIYIDLFLLTIHTSPEKGQ